VDEPLMAADVFRLYNIFTDCEDKNWEFSWPGMFLIGRAMFHYIRPYFLLRKNDPQGFVAARFRANTLEICSHLVSFK
jgi:hypothetical protein